MAPNRKKIIGFGDIHGPKPYKFIGIGDIHGPKPYNFIGFGDIRALNFIGFGALVLHGIRETGCVDEVPSFCQ